MIAIGGMGVIYQATHSVIGRTAAIKVLSERYSSDKNMIKRLHREARAVNQIGHPNIIDIFDFGQTPDRREYFVMEYLPGRSLAQLMEKFGRLPWNLVAPITTQMLDALAAAHDQGIIHRDMKPENVLVVQKDGAVVAKILDFGIAKSVGVGPEGEKLTRAGVVLGTPEYIAPEQIRGKSVDGRADLYGVGVMLFEMIMGRRPFDAEQVVSLLMAHLKEPVPRMDDIPSELKVPDFVPAVVNRALAKNPDQRFPDARTFARALQLQTSGAEPADGTRPLPQLMWEKDGAPPAAPSGVQVTAPGVGPPMVGASSAPTAQMGSRPAPHTLAGPGPQVKLTAPGPTMPTYPGEEPRRRSPLVWALPIALAMLAATAVVLYLALRESPSQPVVAARHDSGPDATPAKEVDLQALFERVRRTLRAGTTKPNPEVRQIATRGFGELGETDGFALLSALLREDPEESVRAEAASAIAKLGDPAGVQALNEARARSSEMMKIFIDEALLRMGQQEGRVGLKEALRSKNKDVRFQAALALGDARDPSAMDELKAMARQLAILNPTMFAQVLGTLARLGHEESYKSLQQAMKQSSQKTEVLKLAAAEALARLGSDEAMGTLKGVLKSGSQTSQLVAAKVLAGLGDFAGLEQLSAGVKAKEEPTRRVAAEGLGKVADRASIPPLAVALDDPDWTVKVTAADSLANILALMPSALVRRTQDWIKVSLGHRDWSVRYAAVGITSDMDPELAVNLLGWALTDDDRRVRLAAVASLGRLRSKKAVPLLRRALVDADDEVRAEAARALAKVGGSAEDADALHATVRDKSPSVGISAAGALLAFGDESYLADLKKAARSRNAKVRREAINALANWKKKDKALALLRRALKDPSQDVRLTAALRLARLGDSSGAAVLQAAVKRGGADQERAMEALASIGAAPTEDIEKLSSSKSPENRRHAVAAAHLLPAKRALAVLARAAGDGDRGVRLAAASALSKMATKEADALPLLRRLARDADPLVRATAAVGLARGRKAHAAISKLDQGEVKPVKEAPLPEVPKPKPQPKDPKQKARPLGWGDVNSPAELYKSYMGQATAAVGRGKWDIALRKLRAAMKQNNTAAVHCEMGEVILKKVLRSAAAGGAKLKMLAVARQQFTECGRRNPSPKLRRKAAAGKRDVARIQKLVR